MRAWRVEEHGEPRDRLRLRADAPEPAAGPGQVLVRVSSVGLNFADILSVQGRYQVRAPLPFTPGIEACGRVLEGGSADGPEAGARVVFSVPWGALAEVVAVDAAACLPAPEAMTDQEAAALLLTYQTSHFALVRRAALAAGEVLLVHNGAGGVGTAAIQIGHALGATVIATAGSDDKLEVCRRCGADVVVDYKREDFAAVVREHTDGRGADVIYDSIGGDVFDASTKCIAFEGRLLVIGFAGGRIPTVAANRIMLKNISVVGLNWGAYRDWGRAPGRDRSRAPGRDQGSALVRDVHERLCEMYAAGTIAPVLFDRYSFEDLPRALDDLAGRRSFGKLVVDVSPKEDRP